MRPHSWGQLWLASPNPDRAHIAVGLLRAPVDSHRFRSGIGTARHLAATAPLSGLLGPEQAPGPQATTDAQLIGFLRQGVGGYQHLAGTCRMGPTTDPEAVVTPTGSVHGVTGLHVIDASLIPTLPAANTNLTVMALTEHCLQPLQTTTTTAPTPH